jgi:hypothetical protein
LRKPTQAHVVLIVVGIAICVAYLAAGARGLGAEDRDYVFSPADDPRSQIDVPAFDVPLGAPPTISALAGRGSLAVALGRRSALRDFAAVSTALTVAVFGAALIAAGLPLLPVMAATVGMAFGGSLWSRGIAYSTDALAPALILLALWLGLRWRARRHRWIAALAIACGVLAMADALAPLIGRNVAAAPGNIFDLLAREFTPLGLFLVLVGVVLLLSDRTSRVTAAVVAMVAAAWQFFTGSLLQPVTFPMVLSGWAAIAFALTWMQRMMPRRAGQAWIAVVAAVLIAVPALTRARLSALGHDRPAQQRARIANDFRVTDVPETAMVVAESRRADATILLSSRQAGRPVPFVPQTPDSVAEALRPGRQIFAFENARANLERHGFLFEPAVIANVNVSTVAAHVACVPLGDDTFADVSLLLATGSFIIHGAGAAPPGVVIRMAAPAPIAIAAIEPRSIPFELGEVAPDAEGVPELIAIARRGGQQSIASLRIPATGRVSPVRMTFTSAPAFAIATAEDPVAVSICAGALPSGVMLGIGAGATAALRMDDNAPFGAGWHPVEADPDFFRWTAAPDASVRIAAAQPTPVRVTITATPASRPPQKPTIGLTVNSCRLDVHSMHAGQGDYEWSVDQRCWLPGVNQLWVHTSPLISPASIFATHDTRLLGARIGAIRLARQ